MKRLRGSSQNFDPPFEPPAIKAWVAASPPGKPFKRLEGMKLRKEFRKGLRRCKAASQPRKPFSHP